MKLIECFSSLISSPLSAIVKDRLILEAGKFVIWQGKSNSRSVLNADTMEWTLSLLNQELKVWTQVISAIKTNYI